MDMHRAYWTKHKFTVSNFRVTILWSLRVSTLAHPRAFTTLDSARYKCKGETKLKSTDKSRWNITFVLSSTWCINREMPAKHKNDTASAPDRRWVLVPDDVPAQSNSVDRTFLSVPGSAIRIALTPSWGVSTSFQPYWQVLYGWWGMNKAMFNCQSMSLKRALNFEANGFVQAQTRTFFRLQFT